MGLVILSYGGPASLSQVEPYLRRLGQERRVSESQLHVAASKYQALGGSPLPSSVEQFRQQVAKQSHQANLKLAVNTAFLYGEPTLEQVLGQLHDQGIRKVWLLSSSPWLSQVSWAPYQAALTRACSQLAESCHFYFSWLAQWPDYEQAQAQLIAKCLASSESGPRHLVFTAHSLPKSEAGSEHYAQQYAESCARIAALLEIPQYRLAYQSAPGSRTACWLGPSVAQVLQDIPEQPGAGVLLVPVGFPFNNMEVAYDLDVTIQKLCQGRQLSYQRVACACQSELLVEALVRQLAGLINAECPAAADN